jgi:hypothetical protein
MDEDVITWNLKGPKRMKKRRELNALLKNNLKYKSLLRNNSNNNTKCSLEINASNQLNNNDSTSENDEFYFSGNKSYIKQYILKSLFICWHIIFIRF